MEGRRWRRARRTYTSLPLQRARQRISHAVSCWYCDFKITTFNDSIYALGRRYSGFFQLWFAIGFGFGIFSLIGATLVLLWDTACTYYDRSNALHGSLLLNWLFGLDLYSSLNLSLLDAGLVIFSALTAVFVHELGHAFAAASQGIQVEYIAFFLAVLFPGAFVAFNCDLLQSSPSLTAFRVYCAGVWHNAVFSAVCLLVMLLLPSFLHPVYEHVEGLAVLNVSPMSPLSGYLTQHDIVVSLDGSFIHNHKDWRNILVEKDNQMFKDSLHSLLPERNKVFVGSKGYCVPKHWLEESSRSEVFDEILHCPDNLAAFVDLPFSASNSLIEDERLNSNGSRTVNKHCLSAKNVVTLSKCGGDWETTGSNAIFLCSEGESCLAPVQTPETAWVGISFTRSRSSGCLNYQSNHSLIHANGSNPVSGACGGTFVFVGSPLSLVDSLTLSPYMPRFDSGTLGLYFPHFLEKLLSYNFRLSLSLAVLNSLPVFFLDGESVLETCLISVTWFRPKVRRRILKLVLYCGSLLLFHKLSQFTASVLIKPG